jgi:O-phosphoseryl-tRNA(Cys) synthetase
MATVGEVYPQRQEMRIGIRDTAKSLRVEDFPAASLALSFSKKLIPRAGGGRDKQDSNGVCNELLIRG